MSISKLYTFSFYVNLSCLLIVDFQLHIRGQHVQITGRCPRKNKHLPSLTSATGCTAQRHNIKYHQ